MSLEITVSRKRIPFPAVMSQDLGVSYREGPYTPEENERVQHAIQQYQTVREQYSTLSHPYGVSQISKLGQEDIEDIVLGTVKCEGFWETISALHSVFLAAPTVS